MENEIDQDFLKDCVEYDSSTGDFLWKNRPNHHFASERSQKVWNSTWAGKSSGSIVTIHNGKYTYIQIGIRFNGKTKLYKAHRLAWLYVFGRWPEFGIDHIDGNSTNNAIANLRDVPQSVNCKNQRISSRNTSGYQGVSWNKRDKAWVAYTSIGKKRVSLGYYKTKEEAAMAVKDSRRRTGYSERHGH